MIRRNWDLRIIIYMLILESKINLHIEGCFNVLTMLPKTEIVENG